MRGLLKDDILKAQFLNYIFYSISYPVTHKVLISNVSAHYIAFSQIVVCLMVIILGKVWNKHSRGIYKLYPLFLLLESLLYGAIAVGIISGIIDYKFYFICDTLFFACISKNIVYGFNKLKSQRYLKEYRNIFDNNSLIVINIASLIGYGISFLWNVPVKVAFGFLLIGIWINNILFYKTYKSTRKENNNA